MTRYLLDTDAIVESFIAGSPGSVLLQDLNDEGNDLCVSDVVLAELFSGLHQQDRAAAEQFLKTLTYLVTTPDSARQAGEWRYLYRRQGIQLSTQDCLIAATALAHGAHVVAGNLRDFPMSEITLVPVPRRS